jgi:hypothetical protein
VSHSKGGVLEQRGYTVHEQDEGFQRGGKNQVSDLDLKLGVGYVSVLDKKLVQKQVLHKVIFLLFGVFHHL